MNIVGLFDIFRVGKIKAENNSLKQQLQELHADESGPLVTGDGIVQPSVLVQEPGTQCAFGQHTTQNAHQCRRSTHAEASDAAEQGTEGIKPPETVQVDSTTPFRTQHSSQIAEQ